MPMEEKLTNGVSPLFIVQLYVSMSDCHAF